MNPRHLFARSGLAMVLATVLPLARAETTASVPTGNLSGVTMRLATPLTVMPQSGFLPVRVSIRNRMPRAGTWKLRFLAGSPEALTGTLASTMELSVEPGQDGDFWYFVPLADAAPRFTLGESPSPNAGPRPAINLATAVAPSTSGVESRAQAKLGYGNRQSWTTRMERGDRPGEVIGIAVATQSISFGAPLPTGRDLPLGFDVEDAFDPLTGVYNRRIFYKESVPDSAGGSAPKSSYWSTVNSSLTAESAARRALEGTGLLAVPPDVGQTVEVTAMESGFSGRQVAWLTTFAQAGSPRVLPLQTGFSLPPGVIVNLHATGRPDEVVRTITFVEPSTLVPPNAAEARARQRGRGGPRHAAALRFSAAAAGRRRDDRLSRPGRFRAPVAAQGRNCLVRGRPRAPVAQAPLRLAATRHRRIPAAGRRARRGDPLLGGRPPGSGCRRRPLPAAPGRVAPPNFPSW